MRILCLSLFLLISKNLLAQRRIDSNHSMRKEYKCSNLMINQFQFKKLQFDEYLKKIPTEHEIREHVLTSAPYVIDVIFDRYNKEITHMEKRKYRIKEIKKTYQILSCPVCSGSSVILRRVLLVLLKSFPNIESLIKIAKTKDSIGDSGYLHDFIIIENYYGKDNHLIIDPTIRQFFYGKIFNPKRIENNIPLIFVGSFPELERIYKANLPPTFDSKRWSDQYRDYYLLDEENY